MRPGEVFAASKTFLVTSAECRGCDEAKVRQAVFRGNGVQAPPMFRRRFDMIRMAVQPAPQMFRGDAEGDDRPDEQRPRCQRNGPACRSTWMAAAGDRRGRGGAVIRDAAPGRRARRRIGSDRRAGFDKSAVLAHHPAQHVRLHAWKGAPAMTLDRSANRVSLQITIAPRRISIIGAGAAGTDGSSAN